MGHSHPDARRLELALEDSLARMTAAPCPPRFVEALRHAVFPGGARTRPLLCYAVARAVRHGEELSGLADLAAVGLELVHCASLVHDDLPAFDGSGTRRGSPSVHAVFGEALAVLVGDALVIGTFDAVARAGSPEALAVIALLARASGAPSGMVAGQAWESEPRVDLADYHRAKTSILFEAATMAGAIAGGHDPAPWAALGGGLGAAYQIADDIADATSKAGATGKPPGRDRALGRPSAVDRHGLAGSIALVRRHVDDAVASIPECPGRHELDLVIASIVSRLERLIGP